jgi:Eco57I restriction-modification methylase
LRENLHGVDIDPRCAQIAQLALWMRAQRAFREFGIKRADRPLIRRTNIVIAEPMPGERELLAEFLRGLKEDRLEGLLRRALDISPDRTVKATKAMADSLAELVVTVWNCMKSAGEMGTLLKIERDLASAIEKGRAEWEARLPLFRDAEYGLGVTRGSFAPALHDGGNDFWTKAERLVFQALADYAAAASGAKAARRRLFAEDAAQGFALADLVAKRFDVVLMNPPFGEFIARHQKYIDREYPEARNDIYAAFVRRGVNLVTDSRGYVGAITSRAFVTGRDHRNYRRSLIMADDGQLTLFLDLGAGVLDGAMVETAAYLVGATNSNEIEFPIWRNAEFDCKGHAHGLEFLHLLLVTALTFLSFFLNLFSSFF